MAQLIDQVLSYLHSPATLALLAFLLVAAVRKHWPATWPQINGMVPVLLAAIVAGVALAFSAAGVGLLGGVAVLSWAAVAIRGALSGLLAFIGANGWTWLTSKLPVPLQSVAAQLVAALETWAKAQVVAQTAAATLLRVRPAQCSACGYHEPAAVVLSAGAPIVEVTSKPGEPDAAE